MYVPSTGREMAVRTCNVIFGNACCLNPRQVGGFLDQYTLITYNVLGVCTLVRDL